MFMLIYVKMLAYKLCSNRRFRVENSTFDKKQKNKKSFLKYLPWVLVILLIAGNGIQFYLNNKKSTKQSPVYSTKCGDFIKTFNNDKDKFLSVDVINELNDIQNKINNIDGYDNDPTCLYMYTMIDYMQSKYDNVVNNIVKLQKMIEDNKVVDYRQIQVESLERLKAAAIYGINAKSSGYKPMEM